LGQACAKTQVNLRPNELDSKVRIIKRMANLNYEVMFNDHNMKYVDELEFGCFLFDLILFVISQLKLSDRLLIKDL